GVLAEWHLEDVLRPDQVLHKIDVPCTFVGNGAALYRSKIRDNLGERAYISLPSAHLIRASTVARLAWKKLVNGDSDDLTHFAPAYVRKSDAQITRCLDTHDATRCKG
ncbi:MAG: hypothetical protein P8Y40_00670, partial [Desulfobacterales bacterium]